jgi:hypothetical protein
LNGSDLSIVNCGRRFTILAWRGTITPPGKEVPAGKYLYLQLIRSSISGWTYPPYFKTVISGIAAPRGRLLVSQLLSFLDQWTDLRSCRGEESVFFFTGFSDVL